MIVSDPSHAASNLACAENRKFDLWAQVVHWQGLAESMGFRVELGGVERVPSGPGVVDVVVVPWVLCLNAEERAIVDRYSQAGGGVIWTGHAGLGEEDLRGVTRSSRSSLFLIERLLQQRAFLLAMRPQVVKKLHKIRTYLVELDGIVSSDMFQP